MFPVVAIVAFTFAAMNMSFQSGQDNPEANNIFQANRPIVEQPKMLVDEQ